MSNKFDKKESKERLKHFVFKKIDTTMIGALSDIEKYQENIDPNTYNNIRTSILDRGNREKRLFETELDKYDVQLLMFKYDFPIQRLK